MVHKRGRLLQAQFACLAYHGAERDTELDGDVLVLGSGEVGAQVVEHGVGPMDADGATTMLDCAPHALVEEDAVGLLAVACILLTLHLARAALAVGGASAVFLQIELGEPKPLAALWADFLA